MTIIDDRTALLDLPLPHEDNALKDDVLRLREALNLLDSITAYKADLVAGKIPASQLPSYVDDVLEYANFAAFPGAGESGKIYIDMVQEEIYRWGGSIYIKITSSPGSTDAVPEGATNKYFTAARALAAIPLADSSTPGLVKIGSGLTRAGDGTISVAGVGGGTGLPAFSDLFLIPTVNGQTTLVPAGGYVPGQIELLKNGVELYGNGDDYTAADGVNIVLAVGGNTTDKYLLRAWAYIPAVSAVAKTGDTMTGALNNAAPVSLASAATTDIGLAASNNVTITGTTTITALGTVPAGAMRDVTFSGALVLTHNATSLILPGAANITTAAGDTAQFQSLGSGNWRCRTYIPADGLQKAARLIRVPVAGTTALAVAGQHLTLENVAATVVTMPAAPAVGARVRITVLNGLATNTIAWNSLKHETSSETTTLIDDIYSSSEWEYISAGYGWKVLK